MHRLFSLVYDRMQGETRHPGDDGGVCENQVGSLGSQGVLTRGRIEMRFKVPHMNLGLVTDDKSSSDDATSKDYTAHAQKISDLLLYAQS